MIAVDAIGREGEIAEGTTEQENFRNSGFSKD